MNNLSGINLFRFFNPQYRYLLSQHFREKRFVFFKEMLSKSRSKSGSTIRILDIGGTVYFWEKMNFINQENVQITLLNLEATPVPGKMFSSIQGDACDLSLFRDGEFDLVFSNSVIEHLYTWENQKKMAAEAIRVGKGYFIQTPNYYFPIEPHWLFPLFHFLPFAVRVFLTKSFSLGHIQKAKDEAEATDKVKEVRLLTTGEMKELFAGGKIYREKFFGLTKSITLYSFQKQ